VVRFSAPKNHPLKLLARRVTKAADPEVVAGRVVAAAAAVEVPAAVVELEVVELAEAQVAPVAARAVVQAAALAAARAAAAVAGAAAAGTDLGESNNDFPVESGLVGQFDFDHFGLHDERTARAL
jgi:hypothetical protein